MEAREISMTERELRELIKSVKFADLLSNGQAILLAKARFIAEGASSLTTHFDTSGN